MGSHEEYQRHEEQDEPIVAFSRSLGDGPEEFLNDYLERSGYRARKR
jgi:hypothetical protein